MRTLMKLAALSSSLPLPLSEAVDVVADLGFEWIDVPPVVGDADRARLRSRRLRVSCVGLEMNRPPNSDLASRDAAERRKALEYFATSLRSAADLGAGLAYLTPPADRGGDTLGYWKEALICLADQAAEQETRLCIEHFPGRALPTVKETLEFLEQLNHPGLGILIDVGHCLISCEDPGQAVSEAGRWLGYLHFDDNDGVGDLHWPLLRGRLSESQLTEVIATQRAVGYDEPLCLELKDSLPDPVENLRLSREIMLRCAGAAGPG